MRFKAVLLSDRFVGRVFDEQALLGDSREVRNENIIDAVFSSFKRAGAGTK